MIDQKRRKTRQKPNRQQLPQLTQLKLEQLDRVTGGYWIGEDTCPTCQKN